ncbi:MAG TPA: VWA domain-containing protein, partial [Spirochaetes bacterium]|nr:VWA domain-containing protein [Spirochaetota bacterium]
PVANADIRIYDGRSLLVSGKTYADGAFPFFPSEYGNSINKYRVSVEYMQNKKEIAMERRGPRVVEIALDKTRAVPERIPLDIVFIMDTTGSMGEEISRLKNTIEIINMNLAALSVKPRIRFGMVLYKDVDDEYVTRVIPLTEKLNDFVRELEKVEASGGGDGPEDLQSALKDAMKQIKWNKDGIRLCYIITDAEPHLDYGQKYTYADAARDARNSAIKIFSVGTGGLNIRGEYILRQISQYTYAKYIFLTYGEKGESEGGREGSVSHHTGSNFTTDKLESIIIRFAKEELAHLSDQKIDMGDPFIQAVKVDHEKNEETLRKLFTMSVTQLIDYSSIGIEKNTPATLIPFNPSSPGLKGNAEYFTEQMSFSLNQDKTFRIVERKELQKVLKELELQYTGLMKDENAVKVGKLMGAKMIIGGALYDKKNSYELFLKLLRVETGEVLSVNKLKIDKKLGVN